MLDHSLCPIGSYSNRKALFAKDILVLCCQTILTCSILALSISTADAGQCAANIAAVDKAVKEQYVPWTWRTFFMCAVCLGNLLKDDAIVTRKEIYQIGNIRQMAIKIERGGFEKECLDLLKGPMRTLRI